MIWENGTETCILSCKKRITSLCLIQNIGCLGLVHGDDPEIWYGVGGWEGASGLRTHVYPWLIHVNVWQNQYSVVKQNRVKIKIKKKNNLCKKETNKRLSSFPCCCYPFLHCFFNPSTQHSVCLHSPYLSKAWKIKSLTLKLQKEESRVTKTKRHFWKYQ